MIDTSEFVPARSLADVFAGIVRLRLGGQTYVLPTLPIEANEVWLGRVEGEFRPILESLTDGDVDVKALLGVLSGRSDHQMDLLTEWDTTGVLPPRDELRRIAKPIELLLAVLALWRVANPLADMAQAGMSPETNGTSPAPTSSLPRNGAGGIPKPSARRSRRSS